MLREGLAAEFPLASRALGSMPRRLVVSCEDPRWAALSAFGTAWLLASAGNVFATIPRSMGFRDLASWLVGAFLIGGAAIGIAVAVRAGGRRGLLWYAIGLAANALFALVVEVPFYVGTCARLGGAQDCSPLRLLLPQIFTLAGAALSLAAVRLVARGAAGTNPVLSAGGAVTLSQIVAFGLWRIAFTQTGDPITNFAIGLGFAGSSMLVAGVVIRRRATGVRSLVKFAAIVLVLWLGGQWPFLWGMVSGAYIVRGPVDLYAALIGPIEIAALFLGWMLLLPGADDRGGLMQVGGGVEADEEDPAPGG